MGQQQFSIEHMELLTLGTAGACPSKKQQLESIKNWAGQSISEPSSVTARMAYSMAVQPTSPPPAIVSHLMECNHGSFPRRVECVAGCLPDEGHFPEGGTGTYPCAYSPISTACTIAPKECVTQIRSAAVLHCLQARQ